MIIGTLELYFYQNLYLVHAVDSVSVLVCCLVHIVFCAI